MKDFYYTFCIIALLISSCQTNKNEMPSFKGDLIAKNVLAVRYELPENIESPDYRWFISDSKEGDWVELPGILTDEIVLLTSYVGKYLKCEISYIQKDNGKKINAQITLLQKHTHFFSYNLDKKPFQLSSFQELSYYF